MTITKGFWEACETTSQGIHIYGIEAVTYEGNKLPVRERVAAFLRRDDAQLCAKAPEMHETLIRVRNYLNTLPPDENTQPLIDTINKIFPDTRKD